MKRKKGQKMQPLKYYCRYSEGQVGPDKGDNVVWAENALGAAIEFWKQNKRNHKLPVVVDVLSAARSYQCTVRLELQVTAAPVAGCGFPVDNSGFSVDKPVDNLWTKRAVIHRF